MHPDHYKQADRLGTAGIHEPPVQEISFLALVGLHIHHRDKLVLARLRQCLGTLRSWKIYQIDTTLHTNDDH